MTPVRTTYRRVPTLQNHQNHVRPGSNDVTFKQEKPWDTSSAPKSSWQAVGEPGAPAWKLSGTQGTSAFIREIRRHHCLTRNACAILFTQSSTVPFLNRLKLPYPDEEILSGYEEDVSVIRDGFYYVGESRSQHYFGTTRGRHPEGSRRIPRSIRQKTRYIFSGVSLRQQRA